MDELPCLRVHHPKASALVALQGAQLLEYTPFDAKPVIWLSDQAEFKQGKSVRGGIPVCWPWFGDARKNPESVQQHLPEGNLPAHGWVRNKPWLLDAADSNENHVYLKFRYPSTTWPAPFPDGIEVSLEMWIGSELKLSLTTFNGSEQTLHFSQALHSYFAISDVKQAQICGLEGVTFLDTLDDWQEKSSDQPICIRGETDRIYLDTPEEILVNDSGWERSISIQSADARSAVVWNPWIEKGKRLSQFGEESYRGMVCVETGDVMENAMALEENCSHQTLVDISQQPLN